MAFTMLAILGPCPVPPETKVRVLFRGVGNEPPFPSRHTYEAKQLRWDRFPDQKAPMPFDIVGYEVVG